VDGRATLLVTGDKTDLLALGRVDGIPIVSAGEAVDRMEG
jgi:predicted nucleic acid-binding protein